MQERSAAIKNLPAKSLATKCSVEERALMGWSTVKNLAKLKRLTIVHFPRESKRAISLNK